MKTAKRMAEEWGVSKSTVIRWCASGIIPPADQAGKMKVWAIPDDWPKPPMARHGLCFLMDTICQIISGANIYKLKFGYEAERVAKGYQYLIDAGFITAINTDDLQAELPKARILPRGEDLLERENKDSKGKVNYKVTIAAKATIGVASIQATGSFGNE